MPAYSSDKEQVEELKQLWKDYGQWMILAVAIGLAGSYAWRYWQAHQNTENLVASDQYQNLLVAMQDNNWDQVAAKKLVLDQQFPKSSYTAFANFLEAKHYVDLQAYPKALIDFQWVQNNAGDSILKQIARLREARILLADNKPADAQNVLAVVDNAVFKPAITEIQGDIALAQKNPAKAGQYYQQAFLEFVAVDTEPPLLAVKAMNYL